MARAAVAQNSAALETARINLRFATITAPISGRIGRSLVTPGGLVSASQATPLAVIQQTDPMFVDMQQSRDRKSVVQGKSVSVRVDLGGRRCHTKKTSRPVRHKVINETLLI